MLIIDHLSKQYPGGTKAVDDVTLHVQPGDLYGFIGHNGAGKTTTLKCAAGILAFDAGTVHINGMSLQDNPVACKSVTAYIPDQPELYPHLTGWQYLSFITSIYGLDQSVESAASDFAALFEILDDLPSQISSYSHGMRQKLALVSAFMRSPRLFMLDEPFVGLDPRASLELKRLLSQACEAGAAVLFSTHVLEVAEKMCNKIAVIKSGRLVASGSTEEVTARSSLVDVFMELNADRDEMRHSARAEV